MLCAGISIDCGIRYESNLLTMEFRSAAVVTYKKLFKQFASDVL